MRVRVSNIVKTYGKVVALQDLSIDVKEGEFLVLLGPSGCGKTTALRIIAGLERPDNGTVYFDDDIVKDIPPGKRNIAMVFQNFALYPHRTVRGNIAYPLRLRKKPKAVIEEAIEDVSRLLSIDHLLDRFPRQLSAGEAQRVGLARAMVRRPRCFLFDEPLSNLDAQLRVRMRAELREIHNQRPATTIYVTHDQEEAAVLADRIVVLRAGRVMQIGTPHQVYTKPHSRFVAGFIGSPQMNFIPGLLRRQGQYSTLEVAGRSLRLPLSLSNYGQDAGLPVVVGIRPEDFAIAPLSTSGEASNQTIQIIGVVKLFQAAGPNVYVHIDVHGLRIVVRCSHRPPLSVGQNCTVLACLDATHVFDRATDLRLNVSQVLD